MKNIEEIRKIIETHKGQMQERFGVKNIGIFGSVVRNEQKESSDIDILVEFDEVPDLITFVELQNHLSDLLGLKVDLVMKSALKPNIGKIILQETLYI